MSISPVAEPLAPSEPMTRPLGEIAEPTLQSMRDVPGRWVVWFRAGIDLADEVACDEPTIDALFGEGTAQRLMITPSTASFRRLFADGLAADLDRTFRTLADDGDVVRATAYSQIYVLTLTGGRSDVAEVLRATPVVALAHFDATVSLVAAPTLYAKNQVFIGQQGYLKATKGINVEPVWQQLFTGAGVKLGMVDGAGAFSGTLSNSPSKTTILTAAPNASSSLGGIAAGPSPSSPPSAGHAQVVASIAAAPDDATAGIGVAPDSNIVLSPIGQTPTTITTIATAVALLFTSKSCAAGDVVNISMGIEAGLDIKRHYDYSKVPPKVGNLLLLTERIGGEDRASAVYTQVPVESEPTVFKAISDLIGHGITVVEAAGNGVTALYGRGKGSNPSWLAPGGNGGDLNGPWLVVAPGTKQSLQAFRSGLVVGSLRPLDRTDLANFDDSGALLVSGGQFSNATSAFIDAKNLNHGNRVDCFSIVPDGNQLGFTSAPPSASTAVAMEGGTSLCAPVVAGCALLVQSIAQREFKAALRPEIVRALLADPTLATARVTGDRNVGAMPDMEKVMKFLTDAKGKKADLVAAITAKLPTASNAASPPAARPGAPAQPFTRHAYSRFVRTSGKGAWVPIPVTGESDVFFTP